MQNLGCKYLEYFVERNLLHFNFYSYQKLLSFSPKRKTRVTHNDFFNNEKHVLSNLPTKAEKMCRYDMDNLDDAWLKSYNGERALMGMLHSHFFIET